MIKEILARWENTRKGVEKIPFTDAIKDMEFLVSEIRRLEHELASSKEDYRKRCQQFKVMHLEIGNVITKYT